MVFQRWLTLRWFFRWRTALQVLDNEKGLDWQHPWATKIGGKISTTNLDRATWQRITLIFTFLFNNPPSCCTYFWDVPLETKGAAPNQRTYCFDRDTRVAVLTITRMSHKRLYISLGQKKRRQDTISLWPPDTTRTGHLTITSYFRVLLSNFGIVPLKGPHWSSGYSVWRTIGSRPAVFDDGDTQMSYNKWPSCWYWWL